MTDPIATRITVPSREGGDRHDREPDRLRLYTAAEAGRLVQVSPAKITRWLRGHDANGRHYEPLWRSQIDTDGEALALGFRDMMEVRVAASFIAQGLPPVRVRQAIALARDITGQDHPLSTRAFRTDGRSVFLHVLEENGETALIDLFRQQYAFRDIVEQSLKHVDYDESGIPAAWWPLGRSRSVLIDPASRSRRKPPFLSGLWRVRSAVRAQKRRQRERGTCRSGRSGEPWRSTTSWTSGRRREGLL